MTTLTNRTQLYFLWGHYHHLNLRNNITSNLIPRNSLKWTRRIIFLSKKLMRQPRRTLPKSTVQNDARKFYQKSNMTKSRFLAAFKSLVATLTAAIRLSPFKSQRLANKDKLKQQTNLTSLLARSLKISTRRSILILNWKRNLFSWKGLSKLMNFSQTGLKSRSRI